MIDVTLPSASVVVETGETFDDTMIIRNEGDATLVWRAGVDTGGGPRRWLTLSPDSAELPPGGISLVTLHYDTTGLVTGTYPGVINIGSNDTVTGPVCAPVSLDVIGAQAECASQVDLTYIAGPPFGIDGSVFRVNIGLGSGSIVGGQTNTLTMHGMRFFLDCTFGGLPGCTDNGRVIEYLGNVTTGCGNASPNFWEATVGTNWVDFSPALPVVIPANTPGFCGLQFDVGVAEGGLEASIGGDRSTPHRVEQLLQIAAAECDNGLPAGSNIVAVPICTPCQSPALRRDPLSRKPETVEVRPLQPAPMAPAGGGSVACVGSLSVSVLGGMCGLNGDVYDIRIALGTREILGGARNVLTISGVRYFLDCAASGLPGCTDEGSVVSFAGNIRSNCGPDWTPLLGPNTVDFIPASPIAMPANTPSPPGFCSLDFQVSVDNASIEAADATPYRVEEMVEVLLSTCDNGLPASFTGLDASGSLSLCPPCDDHDACTSETCSMTRGTCEITSTVTCDDSDACTTESCDPSTGQCETTGRTPCDDRNPCTDDACDPETGQCRVSPDDSNTCSDGDACTTADRCIQGGCVGGPPLECDDRNLCTDDSCTPATGCVHSGNGACGGDIKGYGYWKRLCRRPTRSGDSLSTEDVACVRSTCTFASVETLAELCGRLSPSPHGDVCKSADVRLMTLLLNVCHQRILPTDVLESSCAGSRTAAELISLSDGILCDPHRDAEACEQVLCLTGDLGN